MINIRIILSYINKNNKKNIRNLLKIIANQYMKKNFLIFIVKLLKNDIVLCYNNFMQLQNAEKTLYHIAAAMPICKYD